MRTLIFILSIGTSLMWPTISHAQDGSDILYATVDKIDKTYIGDFIHIDFFRNSFRPKTIDIVSIKVDGKPTKFIEHRQDNGFNNWFDEQYLISTNNNAGTSIRIIKARLEKITTDTVYVTNYIEFYDNEGKLIESKCRQQWDKYPTKIIAAILVSEKSHNRATD